MSAAAWRALSRLRAPIQISAGPWRARSRMDCLPRPLFPPVTRITLPARDGMSLAVKAGEVLQKFMIDCGRVWMAGVVYVARMG